MNIHQILSDAQNLFPSTRTLRRDFHRNPELSFQEVRSAGIISSELTRLGYQVRTGVGKTGVVGLLNGSNTGPVTLIRFDMDALPVQELI